MVGPNGPISSHGYWYVHDDMTVPLCTGLIMMITVDPTICKAFPIMKSIDLSFVKCPRAYDRFIGWYKGMTYV